MRTVRRWSSGNQLSKQSALVLTGGGARGAYQVGVAKYLLQKGIRFSFVCGTSIGGANAVLIAQGSIERLEELWLTKHARDIFKVPSLWELPGLYFGRKLGLLDTQPMEKLLRQEVNLEKLKASPIKLVLIATDLISMETKTITTDDLNSVDDLIDAIMATMALPVVFPPRSLRGAGLYVDGGLVKNTPMQAAMNLGAEEIYLVLLHSTRANSRPRNLLELISRCQDIWQGASAAREVQIVNLYNWLLDEGSSTGRPRVSVELFQPQRDLSHVLDVDKEQAKLLIADGFRDARERFSEAQRKGAVTTSLQAISDGGEQE